MSAPALRLISSMAAREVLAELAAECARQRSQPVQMEAAGGVDVVKRVQAGEKADLVVLSSAAIDRLTAEGHLLADSRVDLAKSGVAIAVPAGAARPDIGSEGAVKRAVQAARAPCYSTGPSGVYLEKLFERWGILQEVRSRIVVPPPGVPVGSLVAKGECDLGFQQLSEMLNLNGIDVVGPLPPAIQLYTMFSGGIPAHSQRVADARQVLEYLASPATAAAKIRFGMQPP